MMKKTTMPPPQSQQPMTSTSTSTSKLSSSTGQKARAAEAEWSIDEKIRLAMAVCFTPPLSVSNEGVEERDWNLISQSVQEEHANDHSPDWFSKNNCILQYKKLEEPILAIEKNIDPIDLEGVIMNKLNEEKRVALLNKMNIDKQHIFNIKEENKKYKMADTEKLNEAEVNKLFFSTMKDLESMFDKDEIKHFHDDDDLSDLDDSDDDEELLSLKLDLESLKKFPKLQSLANSTSCNLNSIFNKLGCLDEDDMKDDDPSLTKLASSSSSVSPQLFQLVKSAIAGTSDPRQIQTSPTNSPTLSMLLEMPPRGPGQPLPEITKMIKSDDVAKQLSFSEKEESGVSENIESTVEATLEPKKLNDAFGQSKTSKNVDLSLEKDGKTSDTFPQSTTVKVYSNTGGNKLLPRRNNEEKPAEEAGKEEEKRTTRNRARLTPIKTPSSTEIRTTRSRAHLTPTVSASPKKNEPAVESTKTIDKEVKSEHSEIKPVVSSKKSTEIEIKSEDEVKKVKQKEDEEKRVTRARASRNTTSTPIKTPSQIPSTTSSTSAPTDKPHQPKVEEHETPRTTRSRASASISTSIFEHLPPVHHHVLESNPSSPSSSTTTNFEEEKDHKVFKRQSSLYLSQIAAHKNASIFLKPITDDNVDGYSKNIKRPSDLSTIKKNIENGHIRKLTSFEREINLMFLNSLLFNASNRQICKLTREMMADSCLIIESFRSSLSECQRDKDKEKSTPLGRREISVSESSKTPHDSEAESEDDNKRKGVQPRKSLKRPAPSPVDSGIEKRRTRIQAASMPMKKDNRLSPDIVK